MASMAAVPTFNEIYGKRCSDEDLEGLLQRYLVDDWLWNLSRLSCLLCESRNLQNEYARAFFRFIVPPQMAQPLAVWQKRIRDEGTRPALFSERYVGILIELAMLYGSRDLAKRMNGDPKKSLLDALLMLTDLEEQRQLTEGPNAKDMDEVASLFAILQDRSQVIDAQAVLVRGAEIYQVTSDPKSEKAQEWERLFQSATGHMLPAYFAGGICSLLPAYVMSPEQIANEWKALPGKFLASDGAEVDGVPGVYFSLRCGTVDAIAKMVASLEPSNEFDAFNLIPIRRYPLICYRGEAVFPLFVRGIAESLCEGVYHTVLTAHLEGRIAENVEYIGGVFGDLFEEYVLRRLADRFGDRLIENPARSDNGDEAADAVLLCEGGVIVFQIKGCHVPTRRRFALKGSVEKEKEIERTGLSNAVDQVTSSISFCREGLIPELACYGHPRDLVIQPLVVTYEPVPALGTKQPFVEGLRASAQVDDRTRPLVLADVGEIEEFCSLRDGESAWSVLSEFSLVQEPTSLHNFFVEKNKITQEYIRDRVYKLWQLLKRRLLQDSIAEPGT